MTGRAWAGWARSGLLACLLVLAMAAGAVAQGGFGVQARLQGDGVSLKSQGEALSVTLALSQPAPYRVRVLPEPPRLVVDINTVDWGGTPPVAPADSRAIRAMRSGHLADGWARLVLDLTGPYALARSEQIIDQEAGTARIALDLRLTGLDEFEAFAQDEHDFTTRTSAAFLHPDAPVEAPAPAAPRKPVVMLDPGHGGIDPGAERGGVREADIVLSFSRQLRETLLRRGKFDVAVTRDADVFVSLDGRIRAARRAEADIFLSIHADALPEGMASGTVVYLLGDAASDSSAAYLAERHDRDDMLAGVDLSRNTDEIARVLMSVAWQDTAPRARVLAEALVEGVGEAGLRLHRRPIQSGAFTVLRAVDMPSVLIELGFMSSPRDLANLQDPAWMLRMAEALADALELWHARDTHAQALRRN